MTDKRRLYKENNEPILNEDGSEKTLEQKIEELNKFIIIVTGDASKQGNNCKSKQ